MATCAQLAQQAQTAASALAQETIRGNTFARTPIPNTTNPAETAATKLRITALINTNNNINRAINSQLIKLDSIIRQQEAAKCTPINRYDTAKKSANQALKNLQNQFQQAELTDQNLPTPGPNADVRPTTGINVTPGTEDDLPEITVVGTKPPQQQLQGTDVNIPTNIGNIDVPAPNFNLGEVDGDQDQNLNGPGGDGLEEVQITARKRDTDLKPGQDQNLIPGSAEEGIDEVVVTAERPQDELEEVVVTARKPTTQGAVQNTRNQASLRQETNFEARRDWRVRLSLSPGATYLYKDASNVLLSPLVSTNGVIFPYTPSVQVAYSAAYGNYRPPGSNYAYPFYDSSSIDSISITGDFTAQDNFEANYLLAVIHFFRSVTKMFYALDSNPKAGTPPPVLFLTGFGQFMFNNHPLLITNFTYTTPTDVDYIRAGNFTQNSTTQTVDVTAKKPINWNWGTMLQNKIQSTLSSGAAAIGNFLNFNKDYNVLTPGGELGDADWTYSGFKGFNAGQITEPTYVPTRLQIQLSATPVPSRLDVSNFFSLKDYANGKLLSGYNGKGKGAGFW